MDRDVLMFAQVMTVIIASVASLVTIGLGARFLWRLGSRPPRPLPPPSNTEQLERLEIMMDGMAIEMERLSEAQRFTVTLLNDRLSGGTDEKGNRLPPHVPITRHHTPH